MKPSTFNKLLLLFAGTILVFIGIYSILQPWQSFGYFVKYTGLSLVLSSVLLLFYSFQPEIISAERVWMIAESFVDLFFATVLIFNPFLTAVAFPMLIGSWVFLRGCMKIFLSFSVSKHIENWRNILVVGVVSVIFGLVFITYPYGRIRSAGLRISIFAIVMGILYIYDALRLRKSREAMSGLL